MFSRKLLKRAVPRSTLSGGLQTLFVLDDLAVKETNATVRDAEAAEGAVRVDSVRLQQDSTQKTRDEEPEGSSGEEEDRQRRAVLKQEERRETDELLALQELLPELVKSKRLSEAEGAICCFIDRHPRNPDGFVLLAEVYAQQNKLSSACESLWGAIHNSPGNRNLLRLLRDSEEHFLLQQCEIPLIFKAQAMETGFSKDAPFSSKGTTEFGVTPELPLESAPFLVMRQGNQTLALANRALRPGDVVFRQRPFVSTPLLLEGGRVYPTCFHCLQERQPPDRGFSCPVSPHSCPFVFCSWECLMRNSRVHALECPCLPLILAAAREAQISSTLVLHIFRTLAKASLQRASRPSGGSKNWVEAVESDVAGMLLRLRSHYSAVVQGQPELFTKMQLLSRRFQKELPPNMYLYLSERQLIELMLVLWQYSAFVSSPSVSAAVARRNPEASVGQVLVPAAALLHHSCVPTCSLSLQEDGFAVVHALTFVPAGGRLCLSVEEDLFKSQKERKGIDAMPRVFGCGCVRCTDSAEGGRHLRGIRCPKCVRGFLNPNKSKSMLERLKAYGLAEGEELALFSTKKRESKAKGDKQPERRESTAPAKQGVTLAKEVLTTKGGIVMRTFAKAKPQSEPQTQTQSQEQGQGQPEPKGAKASPLPLKSLFDDRTSDEDWLCACCGFGSDAVSQDCAALETQLQTLQSEAEGELARGCPLRARRLFKSIIDDFAPRLHPQHAVLFNAHTILAGLLATHPSRNIPQALIYLRRAIVAAEAVLPPCDRSKVHLHLKLAELTFQAVQIDKLCRRGPSLPPKFVLAPLFSALWNSCVCCGANSSLTAVIRLRLRKFAALLGVCTPPLLFRPVLKTEDAFVGLYREVTGRCCEPAEKIMRQFSEDPMFLATAIVRRGFEFPLALELLRSMKDVQSLPTGLSLLGLACVHRHVSLVKHLLNMRFNLFLESDLGVTALLAMCATLPKGANEQTLEFGSLSSPDQGEAAAEQEKKEAAILRLMLQHCDELDAEAETQRRLREAAKLPLSTDCDETKTSEEKTSSPTKNAKVSVSAERRTHRVRLLAATTHRLLGRSGALHLASNAKKPRVTRQLLAAGCSPDTRNLEGATPLHLASIVGDEETAKVLIEGGADVNATTIRGETPLLLASHFLHASVCGLLIRHAANASVQTKADALNVFHCLAVGVSRQTESYFRALSWEGDLATTALAGMEVDSLEKGIYSRGPTYLQDELLMVDQRTPSVMNKGSDLFLFPQEMLRRVWRARQVLLLLLQNSASVVELLCLQCSSGFSPGDLLVECWKSFCQKRESLLRQSELRLAALTEEQRGESEEGWRQVLHGVYILHEMLRFPEEQIPLSELPLHARTPRREELDAKYEQRLKRDAPWLFSASQQGDTIKSQEDLTAKPKVSPKPPSPPPVKEEHPPAPSKGVPPPAPSKGVPPPAPSKGLPPPAPSKGLPPPAPSKGLPPKTGLKGKPPGPPKA